MRSLTHQRGASIVETDIAAFLHGIKASLSESVDAMRAMVLNKVLIDETVTIPVTGVFSRDFAVPFASLAINAGNASVTVTADSPQGQAPPNGPAMQTITGAAVICMSGRVLTIYGPAGTQVAYQLFEKPQPPSYAPAPIVTTAATAQGVTPFPENSTLLGAGAGVNGAAHDTQGLGVARFRAVAAADVAGNLQIQQSRNGVTWFITQPNVGIMADFTQATVLESIITMRFVRAVVTNGAAPQGSFEFDTALVAI